MVRETELSPQWLTEMVTTQFQSRRPNKLVDIKSEPMSVKGDSFTSDLRKIKTLFTNDTGYDQSIQLIAKTNKKVGEGVQEMEVISDHKFETEIYLNILSEMEKLMSEFGDKREILWPKLYGHIPYSTLLLEDLQGRNYEVLPRTKWLKKDHALLVMRSLGRFHAMSKVLMKRGIIGEQYRNIFMLGIKNPMQENYFTYALQLFAKVLLEKVGPWKNVEESEQWGRQLQQKIPTVCDQIEEAYLNYDRRFEVFNHGDFRCSNMAFKSMEYTGVPTEVKFFDFQLPHINTFMIDILIFICLSVDPSYRRNHRSELLEAYQKSLSDNLKFFGWEGYIPTIEDVTNEADRLVFLEFIFLATFAAVVTTTYDDAVSMEKLMTHPAEQVFNKLIFTEEHYVTGVIDDFKKAVELKLI